MLFRSKAWPDQPATLRADTLPLVLQVTAIGLQRGQKVKLQLGQIDDISLEVSATVIEWVPTQDLADATPMDSEESEDDVDASGPLTVQIDMPAAGPEPEPT